MITPNQPVPSLSCLSSGFIRLGSSAAPAACEPTAPLSATHQRDVSTRQPPRPPLAFCVLRQGSLFLLGPLYYTHGHSRIIYDCLAARSAAYTKPVHRRGLQTCLLTLLCQTPARLLLHSKTV
eukprot:GHRQ01026070.1.p4 GENE.GHRQ01026070.1~~GHRQ01026070.1.p4  ORF type:complete len:123 (+),score=7.43 GHRQ01026070.1:282-650(+)